MLRRLFTLACGVALLTVPRPAQSREPARPALIHGDRWLEIDLFWFDRDHVPESVGKFWDRFTPLFAGLDGWKGVVVNIGWTSSYVLDWRGDLNGPIPFPEGMQEENRYAIAGMLTGTTAERRAEWQERFRHPAARVTHHYPPWTYGEIKTLAAALRTEAARRGLSDVKIGSLVLGFRTIYNGKDFGFERRHPNIFVQHVSWWDAFDPRALLTKDETAYGAFPQGIPDGEPLSEFFGRQWGSLSSALGLDAILLRDSMIGPVPYRREGPYGQYASPDPADSQRWTRATANLVRATKLANPSALVIGYSSGASAVGEWRVNSVDLEAIAQEGYLDAWIDQSWAGAWNEVGVRNGKFWNSPTLGWTFQLGYILAHGAQLAGTKTRHYILSDPFDAWESWDSMHTAPERFRWGIWAYLHAAIKTPQGLRMPEGSYISWANQGANLLTEEDVKVLSQETNDALRDAHDTTEILGPTLVYNRPALEWRQQHHPEILMSEWLDEQAASLLLYGVPILSIERIEDLGRRPDDLPLIQTPLRVSAEALSAIRTRLKSGQSIGLFGSRATGTDPAMADLAGLRGDPVLPKQGVSRTALLGPEAGELAANVPGSFALWQPLLSNRASTATRVIYSVDGSPALTLRSVSHGQVLFWDPPEIHIGKWPKNLDASLGSRMGSVYPFLLTARAVNQLLEGTGSLHRREIGADSPGTVLAWRLKDGTLRLMAADLAEGLSDAARQPYRFKVELPAADRGKELNVQARWSGPTSTVRDSLDLPLSLATSELYSLRPPP